MRRSGGKRVVVVDPHDVQRFADRVMENDPQLDAEMAFRLALGVQQYHRMSKAYAQQFATRVRQKVMWMR